MKEVEKLLLIWMKEKQLAGDSILEAVIYEPAKMLPADLEGTPGLSAERDSFKARRGESDKYKKRNVYL